MDTSLETLTVQETFPSFILLEDTDLSEKEIIKMKKEERKERYINYVGEVDLEFLNSLRELELSTYKLGSKKTDTIWDIESLSNIPLNEDVDREKMIMFLMPHDNITYEQAEYLLANNPNHLLTTMTILGSNYQRNIYEIDKNLSVEENGYNSYANFLFTQQEEVVFLTGRTLLVEYNKVFKNKYVDELISEIDGVICRYNKGLIMSIASGYRYRADNEDLIGSGFEGLIKEAIPKFDIDKGNRFSTYASWWIRNQIGREANSHTTVYIPDHMLLAVSQVLSKKKELEKENTDGDSILIDDVINICRKERKYFPKNNQHIKMAIEAQRELISLDEPLRTKEPNSDRSNKYFKTPGKEDSVEDLVDRVLDKKRLYKLIDNANLSFDERIVIELSYGLIPNPDNPKDNTYKAQEIADKLGVDYNEIRRIKGRAMDRLKKSVGKGRKR